MIHADTVTYRCDIYPNLKFVSNCAKFSNLFLISQVIKIAGVPILQALANIDGAPLTSFYKLMIVVMKICAH